MTNKEIKSCVGTIEMLRRLAYNIHGVMDVIDADNCEKIIKALEQEPSKPMVEIDLYSVIKQKYIEREVLDEIRAEIEQNAYPIVHGVNNHELGMTLYGILQIIGKYKAESEDKDRNNNQHN